MKNSRAYQKSRIHQDKIAYAGNLGAFSHIAAMKLFPDKEHVHVPTFEDVVAMVENQEAAYGVLPFENSYTGEVGENMDMILSHDIYIHQMYDLKIAWCKKRIAFRYQTGIFKGSSNFTVADIPTRKRMGIDSISQYCIGR